MSANEYRFWDNVLKAVDASPRPATSIRGASGINHPVIALGVDEDRRRLILISGEHDARTAAMAQTDVQSVLPNMQVLIARPIAVDLSGLARTVIRMLGRSSFSPDEITPDTLQQDQ